MVFCSVRASTMQPPPSERKISKCQEGVCYCHVATASWDYASSILHLQVRLTNGNVGLAAFRRQAADQLWSCLVILLLVRRRRVSSNQQP